MSEPSERPAPHRVAEVSFSLRDFARCQQLADYLSRLAAADDRDQERRASQLSSQVNELLELAYALGADGERLSLAVSGGPTGSQFALSIPASEERSARYHATLAPALAPDAAEAYRAALPSLWRAPGPGVGLWELVAVHGAALSLVPAAGALQLTLTTPHE